MHSSSMWSSGDRHRETRWRICWSTIYIFILVLRPTVSDYSGSAESSTELSIVSVASSTSIGRGGIRHGLHQPSTLPGADLAIDAGSGDYELPPRKDSKNETREALSEESTTHEHVVFLADNPSYVPVPALRSRGNTQEAPVAAGSHGLEWKTLPDGWDREYRRFRYNTTRVQHIEAECQDEYMKIRVGFNGSFAGLVYSAGYAYDPECMYINGSGRDYYEFYIQLNRCGTLGKNTRQEDPRKAPSKNFMWNTVTVQYNPLIEEEYDEHFKVTCEYGYDFWKTVTFPFLDVEVATGNPVVFTLQPPECYMEIRTGYGTQGARVAGPVRVGDPLTLIIYMRSKYDGFDIVVNDCYAHNGGTKKIQLIDEFGCPVDDKLISRFRGSWSESGVFETQVFAYMKTFRFTGSPALYIECDVRMCHGRCPSQPCHWRNVKTHRRRRAVEGEVASSSVAPPTLSENINLFQSLRVLQEGEDDEEFRGNQTTSAPDPNQTCMKSSLFTTIIATGCVLLCLMSGALVAAWNRLRNPRSAAHHGEDMFHTYVQHKGRIK